MTDTTCDNIQFLNKKEFVHIYGKRLPHWFQENKTVFVTFRLADSLPQEKLDELKKMERETATKKWMGATDRKSDKQPLEIARRIERWIDAGHGSCILADKRVQTIVSDAIRFFDEKNYLIHAFVIMPNHVHLLLTPLSVVPIVQLIAKVKSFTAHRINEETGKTGTVWQHGIFDRIVRDADDFDRYMEYICNNPKGLKASSYALYVRKKANEE